MKRENASDAEEENIEFGAKGEERVVSSDVRLSTVETMFLAKFGVDLFSIIELDCWIVKLLGGDRSNS